MGWQVEGVMGAEGGAWGAANSPDVQQIISTLS